MEDRGPREGPDDPDPPEDEVARPTAAEVSEAIRRDILAIHRDSYGRGADRIEAHVLDDTVFVILDGIELLPNEEFLIESGRGEAVVGLRRHFQEAIETTFRAAVERATGRRVRGFASLVELDDAPPFVVEIFRLEPK
ncbi:MAG TPA: Na-translocating system protein MpsC family protein [Solirubrobacterales bacterium]|nr:Na-translocating system protein MpsC family protein [Solirubrobacterales bacterium]